MDIPSGLLSSGWSNLAWLIYGLTLMAAVYKADWWRLRKAEDANIFWGICLFLWVLWMIKAGVRPGLNFHMLGITIMTLMFGWAYAVIGASVVLAGVFLMGDAGWEMYALNAVLMGLVPIAITWNLLYLAQRYLPHNYFIYIFINAFVAAGLSGVFVAGSAAVIMWLDGAHSMDTLSYDYLPYFPLMFFPEALFNGMIMSVLVGLKPEWVSTFDDDLYLKGK